MSGGEEQRENESVVSGRCHVGVELEHLKLGSPVNQQSSCLKLSQACKLQFWGPPRPLGSESPHQKVSAAPSFMQDLER